MICFIFSFNCYNKIIASLEKNNQWLHYLRPWKTSQKKKGTRTKIRALPLIKAELCYLEGTDFLIAAPYADKLPIKAAGYIRQDTPFAKILSFTGNW